MPGGDEIQGWSQAGSPAKPGEQIVKMVAVSSRLRGAGAMIKQRAICPLKE